MKAYDRIEEGFSLKLDMRLFERSAVMKALYRFHDKYVISYEIEGQYLCIDFETTNLSDSYEEDVSEIMKELSFQMIRLDTVRHTHSIRELLVARALYATCIEPERNDQRETDAIDNSDWHKDKNRIFASWFEER